MTGSIVNVLPLLNSWSSMLLSFAAWIQLSFLSSYPKSAIHRALQGAIPRVLSRTPWDISLSLSFCRSILPLLPCEVRKSHCYVFLGGLDPGQAPLKTLLLMPRLT